jgi:D-psicose/D-tagatose/L-ribulose 3-epimerase
VDVKLDHEDCITMKVGMNLLLWTIHPTAQEHGPLLRQIKEWGFDGVEFPLMAMQTTDVREIARQCDDLGLGRTAILAFGADEADPISPDATLRRRAVDLMKASLDKTRELGADILVGPMFQGLGRFTGAAPTPQERAWCLESLGEVANHAASMHVRLGLEPLNRFEMYLTNTVADAARFCDELGMANVGLLADTHHANIEEEDPAGAWKNVAKRIFHVHISENHRGIPGSGHAVTPGIFRALRESGYDGWLTIEAFGQNVPELIVPLHIWRSFFEREEDVAVEGLRHIREGWERAGKP